MPRRTYNPAQRVPLDRLGALHRDYIMERATIRERIQREYEAQLQKLMILKSQAANEAIRAGVAKTDIGRAVGTSNWETINELLSLTAGDWAVKDATIPFDEYFTWEGNNIRVDWPEYQTTIETMRGNNFPVHVSGVLGMIHGEWVVWEVAPADHPDKANSDFILEAECGRPAGASLITNMEEWMKEKAR